MSSTPEREEAWIAVALAWIAGGVDAIGFLGLTHLFTAHMSGNSAALGAFLGQGNWSEAGKRLFPIPVFVLGVLIGALLVDGFLRKGARLPLLPAFFLEALLLLACLWVGGRHSAAAGSRLYYHLASMASLAMGVQNATLRRVGRTGVRTTYITGMLTNFAEEVATYCVWLRDRTRRRGLRRLCLALRVSPRQGTVRKMGLFGGIWIGYIIGAVLGSIVQGQWRWEALAMPLTGLAVVCVLIWLKPFDAASAIEEKAKQS